MSGPDALRSLNQRLSNAARAAGTDPQRLRRQLAFQRLLVRVAPAGWVLKGGYCLEVRLPHQARATKDVDFVRRHAPVSGERLLDELDEIFRATRVGDGFAFEALSATAVRAPEDPAPAWRVKLECRVGGHRFEHVTLDLVAQYEEVEEAVEPLVVAPPVAGLDLQAVTVPAVAVYQHAAEKLHAMGRMYAGDRPSSRVKDLVDLVLLIEAGLLVDVSALAARLAVVYRLRDGGLPPGDLVRPPGDWAAGYARLTADLTVTATHVEAAYTLVRAFYLATLSEGPPST